MKLSHVVLALSLALGAGSAAAQNAPPPNPANPSATRPAPVAAQASGNLARYIVGPGGRVRGFALNNGTVVMLPFRAGGDFAQRVAVGVPVRVEGFSMPGAASPVIFRVTVRGADGAVLAARFASIPQQSVRGTVQQVIAGPRGGGPRLLLNNNVTVFVPHEMTAQVTPRGIRVGESVQVVGRGTATPQGTGVLAEQITFADGTRFAAALAAPAALPAR